MNKAIIYISLQENRKYELRAHHAHHSVMGVMQLIRVKMIA